jgi:hypothetical protein
MKKCGSGKMSMKGMSKGYKASKPAKMKAGMKKTTARRK